MNTRTSTSLRQVFESLSQCGVDFVVVGSAAAAIQGSPYPTHAIELCVPTTDTSLRSLRCWADRPGVSHPVGEEVRSAGVSTITLEATTIQFVTEVPGFTDFREVQRVAFKLEIAPDLMVRVLPLRDLVRSRQMSQDLADAAQVPTLLALLEHRRSRKTAR